jgi:hypothetical protein
LEEKPKWTFTQAFKDILRKWTEDDTTIPVAGGQQEEEDVSDGFIPGDPEYDDFDEDNVESLIILGLCVAVGLLLWRRNMRNVMFQGDQGNAEAPAAAAAAAGNEEGDNQPVPAVEEEENRGLFPDPNDPDNPEFARWIGGAPVV